MSAQNIPSSKIEPEPSYWDMMISGIVRPPRAKYQNSSLGTIFTNKGNKVFTINGASYFRQDINIPHSDKHLDITIYMSSS